MKTFLITLVFCIVPVVFCNAQTLELKISNPQPRLGQSFSLSVDIDTVCATFFSFLSDKFKLSTAKNASNETPEMAIEAVATKLGRNKIGPLSLAINGRKYITNAVEFDIADSLPAVDKGFWIRTSRLNDTTVLVLTDQRIPALTYYDRSGNSLNITQKTSEADKEAKLIYDTEDIDNAKVNLEVGRSETQSIQLVLHELNFKYCFWVYKITIFDKKKPVILHKGDFRNIPDYYNFKDIKIN
jgi:hypothetical protein